MVAASAFRDGLRRVNGAPMVVLGMSAVTLLIALPLSIALGGMIEAHLGVSMAAGSAAAGINYDWWQEFSAQASGPRDDVRAVDHRLRRRARQSQRAAGQHRDGDDDRRRGRRLDGDLVVPERRRARSARTRAPHACERVFRRLRRPFLALRSPRRRRLVHLRDALRLRPWLDLPRRPGAADPRRDGRAHEPPPSCRPATWCSARSSSPSTSCSTTRGSGSWSRTGAARWPPSSRERGSPGAIPVPSRRCT